VPRSDANEPCLVAPPESALLTAVVHLHLHLPVHLKLFHHVKGPAIDYVGVAVAAFASWAGVTGPGEPVLIAAGVFASKHKLDVSPVILWAWVGATVGGIVGWVVGLMAGRRLLTIRGPFHKMRLRAVAKGEEVFRRMEVIAIILAPSWLAGIHRSSARVYLPTNAISALLLWALPLGLGAYYAGPPVLDLASDAGTVATAIVIAVILAVVGFELARRARRRGREEPEADTGRPRY
jgi:membrane protein DedA with SNARE-associated domain